MRTAPPRVVVGAARAPSAGHCDSAWASTHPTGSWNTSRYHTRHREARRDRHRRTVAAGAGGGRPSLRGAVPAETVERAPRAGRRAGAAAGRRRRCCSRACWCPALAGARRPGRRAVDRGVRRARRAARARAGSGSADSGIPAGWNPGEPLKPAQAEGLRKLLLSLASDVRLVLLRLAMQLVRLRHLKGAHRRGAAARGARDARDLRAARQPPGHLARQVGARGPRLPLQPAGGLQAHRRLAAHQARRARALHRGRASRARARTREGRRRRPRSPAGRSTSTASGGRCSARAWRSSR